MIALIMLTVCQAAPAMETFAAPGFDQPVCGVWYEAGQAASDMPLGALGTGFLDISSKGSFGATTTENSWLQPKPAAAQSGFTIAIGEKIVTIRPDSAPLPGMRFWGHFPAADVDFGPTFGATEVRLRAFSPLIPHQYELSNLPAALFHFSIANRSDKSMPVRLGLQWQAQAQDTRQASGNAEGALGWTFEAIPPGEQWTAPVIYWIGDDKKALKNLMARPPMVGDAIKGEAVPEGYSYDVGNIQDFLLDAHGGFQWETNKRYSASFNGAGSIAQWLWQIQYSGQKAGRNLQGPFGFQEGSMLTLDGKLSVMISVYGILDGEGMIVAYTFKNMSTETISGLRLDVAVNADIGGSERSEKQQVAYRDPESFGQMGGLVFEDPQLPVKASVVGIADYFAIGTWPNVHQAMDRGEMTSTRVAPTAVSAQSTPNGMMLVVPNGSYAVGVERAPGWSITNDSIQGDIIRTVAQRELAAGKSADIVLALAWNFPTWNSSDGETLTHRYTLHYSHAGQVLQQALAQGRGAEKALCAWQSRLYQSQLPPLLKDALMNGMYVLARNSWWLEDGRFFQSESFTGCPITETFVCRFNGAFPLALLWPDCERATLKSVADAQAESGEIPFGFGNPLGSKTPMFHCQHPIVSSEFVLNVYRDFVLWKDKAFLTEMYPAVQRALRFAMSLDKDGDGLVNDDPGNEKGWPANQYYDIWPWWGTSAYTASIGLAAAKAGMACAQQQGDAAFADELTAWFGRGAAAFEQKLWTGEYYRLYNDPEGNRRSETSLTNALCGQWAAYTGGLGSLLPDANVQKAIDTIFRLNVAATPYGAVNGVGADGKPDTSYPDHSAVITIGEVWNFCAMAAFAGRVPQAVELFNRSYENLLTQQKTPWNIPWSLDAASGAPKWGWNYYSNPCVWSLFQALDPQGYAAMNQQPMEEQ